MVEKFLEETKVQCLTTIVLSDGCSNHISLSGENFITYNGKQYPVSNAHHQTRDLVNFVKKSSNTKMIGFFMCENIGEPEGVVALLNKDGKQGLLEDDKQAFKNLKTELFAEFKNTVYDGYYVIANSRENEASLESKLEKVNGNNASISDAYIDHVKARAKHRKILRSFIDVMCEVDKK
jgi:hypothetical protein